MQRAVCGASVMATAQLTPPASPAFYMYADLFPKPDALLGCRGLKRLAPFGEPMAQFYSELGVYRALAAHPSRVLDPERASLFYVPLLPHMSQDAGRCDGIGHRQRLSTAAAALQASPQWRRHNGTDHFWTCACVMMKSMLGNELWAMLRTSVHAVHSIPRGGASPAECLLQVPYFNPDFVGAPRAPGAERPTLAHFRGRVMNNVRAKLGKAYGRKPHHINAAAHPTTAAKCNLNKCSPKTFAKVTSEGYPAFSVTSHFAEMTRSTFCLVPVGDSPPSSRLYLAVSAGCVPVFISDDFVGAFPHDVPWDSFTLRVPEAAVRGLILGRRRSRDPAETAAGDRFNLTAMLLEVVADPPRLLALQRAMFAHAPDVLYEAPASRVGDHLLRLVATAATTLCVPSHRNDVAMQKSHGVSYNDPPVRPAPKLPKKKQKRLAAGTVV